MGHAQARIGLDPRAAHWPTKNLLSSVIFDYIEGFYNPERIQKRLGYRSPADYEDTSVA